MTPTPSPLPLPLRVVQSYKAHGHVEDAKGNVVMGAGPIKARTFITQAVNERAGLLAALRAAEAQLAIGRRYLPSHGTFGEEGLDVYESAQREVRAALNKAEK